MIRTYTINKEIEDAILKAIDLDTGELVDEKYLELMQALKIERSEMALDIACIIKDYQAEIAAHQARIEEQKSKIDKLSWKIETQERLLKMIVPEGEKLKDDRSEIKWTKSESVQIDCDPLMLPERFVRVKTEANKVDLKKALKAGEEVTGVRLVENLNLSVK